MTAVLARLRQLRHQGNTFLQFLEVAVVPHFPFFVARQVGLIDVQRQLAEVTQVVQLHLLLLCGAHQLVLHADAELGVGHFLQLVAELVYARPLGPSGQRLVQVGIALCLRGIAAPVHVVVAFQGQLCRHVEVAILLDE